MSTKLLHLAFVALSLLVFSGVAHIVQEQQGSGLDRFPRRDIAGVSVIDTPIIRAAQKYAREHSDDELYNHIMRSWLFGTLLLQHNETLRKTVDPEVHAAAAVLHDLGLDRNPNSTLISPDKRFEVDGAIAARNFIRAHRDGKSWEERRVQLVWDAIALHGDPRLSLFKEPEVASTTHGVRMDFSGPEFGVSQDEYNKVMAAFPKKDFSQNTIDTMVWLCQTKPETTYETFAQGYGDEYVPGYSAIGHRAVDNDPKFIY